MKVKSLVIYLMIVVLFVSLVLPTHTYASTNSEEAKVTFDDGTEARVTQDDGFYYIKVYVDGVLDQDVQMDKNSSDVNGTVNGGQKSVSYNAVQYYENEYGGYSEVTNPFHYIDDKYSDEWNRSGTLYGESETEYGDRHTFEFTKGMLLSTVFSIILSILNPFAVALSAVANLVYTILTGITLGVVTEYVFGTLLVKVYRNTYWVYSEGILGLKTTREKYYADVNRDTPGPDSFTEYVGSSGPNYSNDEMLDIGIYNAYMAEN